MKTKVTLQRSFSASAERVFDAWLIPTLVGKWMVGPRVRDEEIVNLENAVRIGGTFSYAVRRQGEIVDHICHYMEIRRPEKLVFSWAIAGQDMETDPPGVVRVELQEAH